MSFIQTYFLRMYCIERERCKDEVTTYRDALYQARLLVYLLAVNLSSAALVVLGRLRGVAVLDEYRTPIVFAMTAGLLWVSFLIVGHAVRKIDHVPKQAESYSSDRDRVLSHIQFWCTFLPSLALPFVVGLILPGPVSGRGG